MECYKNNLGVQTPISQKFRSPKLGVTSGSQILLLTPNFSFIGENTLFNLNFDHDCFLLESEFGGLGILISKQGRGSQYPHNSDTKTLVYF